MCVSERMNLIFTVFVIVQIAAFWILYQSTSRLETVEETETKFAYFFRSNCNNSLTRYQVKDKIKSVFLYSHGFHTENLEIADSMKIKNAVFQTQSDIDMVVLVDWSTASMTWNYPAVANKIVPKVAKNVTNEILWMQQQFSLDRSNIQLAGHSLGAHIMGQAAKILNNDTFGKIANITGIDPAGPLFDELSDNERLSKDDADNVRCIYTDPGLLGTSVKNCTENLFPCSSSNFTDEVNSVARHNSAKNLFIDLLHGKSHLCTNAVKDSYITWCSRCLMKLCGRNLVIYMAIHTKYFWFAGVAILIDVIFVLMNLIACCCSFRICNRNHSKGNLDQRQVVVDIVMKNNRNGEKGNSGIRTQARHLNVDIEMKNRCTKKTNSGKNNGAKRRGFALILANAILAALLMVLICSFYHER